MNRAYYSSTVEKFLNDDSNLILGQLSRNHQFALEDLQRNSWIDQIEILKSALRRLPNSFIVFEYTIPRMGKRVTEIIDYCVVARGGIEPPTHGFSVRCSTN